MGHCARRSRVSARGLGSLCLDGRPCPQVASLPEFGLGKQAYIAVLAAFGLGLTAAPDASADSLDPALSRLVVLPACNGPSRANPDARLGEIVDDENIREAIADQYQAMGLPRRDGLCAPDNQAFKRLVSEWGFALAPAAAYSARTTGFGGFHLSFQGAYTAIDSTSNHWKMGVQGERDPSTGAAPEFGRPPSIIQLYSLNIRKNFGMGIESMANVGFVPDSNIINGGADIRVSLLEGFRTGVLGYFPDLAIGGGIRTISGTDQLQLTTVALDARLSKPFTIASSSVLTPTVGFQYVWIFGRSGMIDLTPATDPLGYCGYTGPDIPRQGSGASDEFDGQSICAGGSSLDFNNNVVFEKADLERQRLVFGLNYRYEMVTGGLQFITDMVDPADAQSSERDSDYLSDCDDDGENCKSVPRQWQLSVELGAAF